ncbi:hypothetical protein A5320_20740 [Rheinheimera sp. SA_1]|uniref:sensor histidine kinase n=1 Tax=Rheinheimera sp. SA_1 TaxID=1827365 RepID=UPI000801162E|nr:sensor histidine kinase [Rheinheimera sp. SA_1]OBP17276.1 hypothetical protein A5320_20740 [Rheinheimera sp. SA_1]
MATIPFNVSARTALLIGRENIANAKGAVIELVKNCYDADSPFSIIVIDNRFYSAPTIISHNYYLKFKKVYESEGKSIDNIYARSGEGYSLVADTDSQIFCEFERVISVLNSIYIIDNGEGMTEALIRKNWMTIGTDNKLQNATTPGKRVKSGAKGIGRFALDKLGEQCELVSIPKSNSTDNAGKGVFWTVNWSDFERPETTIDKVNARVEDIKSGDLFESCSEFFLQYDFDLNEIIARAKQLSSGHSGFDWVSDDILKHGTVIRISRLHDIWKDTAVKQLYQDLEVLVPPRDVEEFSIHILSNNNPNSYGEVLSSVCDDFDYKLHAYADKEKNVVISIYREEYDEKIIPREFFERASINKNDFVEGAGLKKMYTESYTFSELMPGVVNSTIFDSIGSFEFILYYLKKGTDSINRKRFFYKYFEASERKQWLEKFGGIKLYRDNFRVRPYGEVGEPAFDWLGLGARKASSPAGVTKREGGYRVEPENIAGLIKISRLSNIAFQDKSSREGLQESDTLKVFKEIIKNILSKLEDDRSTLAREFDIYYNEKYGHIKDRDKAIKLAESIASRSKITDDKQNHASRQSSNHTEDVLAQTVIDLKEDLEQQANEITLLRGLASSGIMSAAFSHDYGKIKANLQSRVFTLKSTLDSLIDVKNLTIPDYKNPFILLNTMEATDRKIATWLGFSLGFTRKDKRNRKKICLKQYVGRLLEDWRGTFDEVGITPELLSDDNVFTKAFEVDFDSVFINLFTNSMAAFELPSSRRDGNRINISIRATTSKITITYQDNGPGIPKEIKDPNSIFLPKMTTKRDPNTGEEIGTGLGMWILKKIVEEYKGEVNILSGIESGFGLSIVMPKVQNVGKADEI